MGIEDENAQNIDQAQAIVRVFEKVVLQRSELQTGLPAAEGFTDYLQPQHDRGLQWSHCPSYRSTRIPGCTPRLTLQFGPRRDS